MRLLPQRFAAVAAVALLAVPAMLPLVSAALAWAVPAGEIWQHQLQHVLPRVAGNTVLLLALVAAATGVLGTALAWLVAGHEFPGRSIFAWALLLPLAVPGYVLAVVFAGALDFAGPLQSWLRDTLGTGVRLPPIRSLGGAALVLSLCLYPYVYMLARVAFETGGARTLEAAQTLGMDRRSAFRRALLPLARPAIAAGVGLVCMETLADFGVVAALNVDTFTTAIYRAWYGMFSIAAALQMAAVLALLALAGVWAERRMRGGRSFAGQRPTGALPRLRLTGARAFAATGLASLVLAVAFVLPMAQLLAWAVKHAASDLDARYWAFAGRSVALAASGSLVVVAAAVVHGYALRLERWLDPYMDKIRGGTLLDLGCSTGAVADGRARQGVDGLPAHGDLRRHRGREEQGASSSTRSTTPPFRLATCGMASRTCCPRSISSLTRPSGLPMATDLPAPR